MCMCLGMCMGVGMNVYVDIRTHIDIHMCTGMCSALSHCLNSVPRSHIYIGHNYIGHDYTHGIAKRAFRGPISANAILIWAITIYSSYK